MSLIHSHSPPSYYIISYIICRSYTHLQFDLLLALLGFAAAQTAPEAGGAPIAYRSGYAERYAERYAEMYCKCLGMSTRYKVHNCTDMVLSREYNNMIVRRE